MTHYARDQCGVVDSVKYSFPYKTVYTVTGVIFKDKKKGSFTPNSLLCSLYERLLHVVVYF